MNSLKTILFSSLLLVACQATTAQAKDHIRLPVHTTTYSQIEVQGEDHTRLPIYRNAIANISLDGYEGTMLTGSIKLENGMLMHIVDYKTRDDNIIKTWRAGDVLVFKAHRQDDALVLSAKKINGQKEEVEPYLLVDVTKEAKSSLMISEINDDGKFIKLSDGTVWEFSWFNQFSTKKWKVGEHVIVQGPSNKNCYEFINVDAPVSLNVANAKASFVLY